MDSGLEMIFGVWKDYDSELDPEKLAKLEKELNRLIDTFLKAKQLKYSRCMFKFYSRDEYAKWRTARS